jgi:hypothetical protein
MKLLPASCLFFACSALSLSAADKIVITVTQDLEIARPSETIVVPWSEVTKGIPGALLQHLQVRDAAGNSLPYQVTNTKPLDPKGSYGDLLFQHDFKAGEKSATFTVEKLEAVAPPFPSKTYARYIPERLDDFAWENDKVGHRTYGPALAAPDELKVGKEVLVTSGLDVWCKRVDYPVVDRWYNKGHNHYHHDEGEGMDMYQVGTSRGCGGTGVWDGKQLYVARNYKTWSILANGPIRTIFELSYETWTANGTIVSETKRFTVDAGHNLDQIESTFNVSVGPKELTVGIGINKNSGDKGQDSVAALNKSEADGALIQWETQKTNGSIGEAVIVTDGAFGGFAEDSVNQLILAKVTSGKPVRYLVGAGWSKAGEFTTKEAWNTYVAACAARAKSPVKIAVEAK